MPENESALQTEIKTSVSLIAETIKAGIKNNKKLVLIDFTESTSFIITKTVQDFLIQKGYLAFIMFDTVSNSEYIIIDLSRLKNK